MRVQIPAYTDRWMMGDRYGDVVGQPRLKPVSTGVANRFKMVEVVRVTLDKSGKTMPFILDDCTVL